MNVEYNRLRTFSDWPTDAVVHSVRLAEAGFYYSGSALEVQCFLCGVKISVWGYRDQPIVRHRIAAPQCPFVVNPIETCNVPIWVPGNNSGSSLLSTNVSQGDNVERQPATSFCQNTRPQKEYKNIFERLQTFADWPIPLIASPEKLARSGFHYLKSHDMVQCVNCRSLVFIWDMSGVPNEEHRAHFPECNFYIHQNEDGVSSSTNMYSFIKEFMDLGVQCHSAPKKPHCATYEGRLRTFFGWPESLKQTPEMLASAGFFYNGYGDLVRCFHCDGGVRNWEETDDPWTEHARWFPKCGFVNLVRGQEFIKKCIETRPPLDPSIFEGVAEDEATAAVETLPAPPSVVSPPAQEVTEAMLERLLVSPPAIAALEIGLQVGRVKKALKKRMEQTGVPYANPDQLIVDVLDEQVMEDDDSRLEIETPESPSSEIATLINRVIREQTNNATEQHTDAEESTICQKINEDTIENNEYSNNEEKSKTSSDEDNSLGKKSNVKSKTTASLKEENRRLKEARLCKICMDRELSVVFLPCGHLATCVHCAPSLTHCPMCRREILATVRTFLS